MKTTLEQIELLGEVLDFTDFATQENLDTAKGEILTAVENAKPEIDFSSVENKVQEESAAIQKKIDNIKLPEIDTSELAKQGENQEATNSKIYEELQKVAAVDSDILQGKRRIASALTLKGVDASYTESLQDFSVKINQIQQKQYLSIGDDKFYYPQPYMQSIFMVAEDLKKSDMPEYIPAYVKEYKHMFGVNQFAVVDYYQQSIVLESADGVLTSDGYFYTKAGNVITRTFPNGETEKYEGMSIEHTFSNSSYINNWCAYFFVQEGYTFAAANDYWMNIVVCGKCGSLDMTRFNNVYIDGEITGVQCSADTSVGEITLVNYVKHNNGQGILRNDAYCRMIKLLDLTEITNNSTIILLNNIMEVAGQSLRYLFCPFLKSIKNGSSIAYLNGIGNVSTTYRDAILWNLEEIKFEELETIDSTSYIFNGVFTATNARKNAFGKTERIYLPKLKECTTLFQAWYNTQNNIFWWFINLKSIELPSLLNIPATMFSAPIEGYDTSTGTKKGYSLIELLDYSSATSIGTNLGGICAAHTTLANLIDLRVGALEASVNAQYWTATNVIADETKKAQLQQNIHNHIAERVSDRTGTSALTFTFSQEVRNVLLPETEELFAAKNWNIAPTRTS